MVSEIDLLGKTRFCEVVQRALYCVDGLGSSACFRKALTEIEPKIGMFWVFFQRVMGYLDDLFSGSTRCQQNSDEVVGGIASGPWPVALIPP